MGNNLSFIRTALLRGFVAAIVFCFAHVSSSNAQPHLGDRPESANLLYDPETGEVILSALGKNAIISFAIGTVKEERKLLADNAEFPFKDTGKNTDLTPFQIGQALDPIGGFRARGFRAHGLGAVLPDKLTQEDVVEFLDIAVYSNGLGHIDNFDVLPFAPSQQGDFTGDERVDLDDANAFCRKMAGGRESRTFNLIGDQKLEEEDLTKLLEIADRLPGDADWDGTIGFSDFLELSTRFGEEGTFGDGDFDCDGTISFADFLKISENFGKSKDAATAPVPEPTRSTLLTLFVCLLIVRPRVASARS